ncbi:DUF4431 domain-containing protein [Roseateles agri]|uniref:DUF4431 domain-containing protein n=1 Tax=Roseateles agri TaxID=3098619 RepID=UPI003D6788FA
MNRSCTLALLLLACGGSVRAAPPCLSYTSAEVSGTLVRQTFAEQPNYESIAAGDAPATYFFLKGAKPSCVAAGSNTSTEPAERNIRWFQLVLATPAAYDELRPSLGNSITCRGSLFHSISGHHHSRVLLQVDSCDLSAAGESGR